jgi:hypothetical protein
VRKIVDAMSKGVQSGDIEVTVYRVTEKYIENGLMLCLHGVQLSRCTELQCVCISRGVLVIYNPRI